MNAKRVWGIVLIVLGVVAVIAGFQQFVEMADLDNLIGQYIGNASLGSISRQYEVVSHNAKIGGMIKIVAGILMALIGTWMVKDEEPIREDKQYFQSQRNYDEWK